ncbi:hypothetical protein HPB50_020999 [Hyalomma asiaticum]|uniref:Uncharacterized protein n=1 Tax=Hyalomma asiaticum TaxID=266040 RepID=A0ACB7T3Y7_HYAAI|nr:hypothetical protein HPB50_020999 [Hyalomma asiaticum]
MATHKVHSARHAEIFPSSITIVLFAIISALQILLADGQTTVRQPHIPDEHDRVVYRPGILSVRTGERSFSVPLRRKRAAAEPFAGDDVSPPSNCAFEGTVYEQGVKGTGRAVVVACPGDPEVHAMIITAGGEAISVAPNRNRGGTEGVGSEDEEGHVVHRLPSTSKLLTSWSKLSTRRRRATSPSGRVIELAVFVDAALKSGVPDQSKLHKLLLAMLEQVQLILEYRSLGTPIKLDIVHLEVLDSRNGPATAGGEVGNYLDNFCTWQCRMNRQRASQGHGEWDHAILLSGLDLHSKSKAERRQCRPPSFTDVKANCASRVCMQGGNDRVVGLAYVGGMCQCRFSCTLIQAESFQAALEAAHEIGHNLGMDHDGTGNRCDPTRFIMSPGTGAGKTNWSSCSRRYLEDFLATCAGNCGAKKDSGPVRLTQHWTAQPVPPERLQGAAVVHVPVIAVSGMLGDRFIPSRAGANWQLGLARIPDNAQRSVLPKAKDTSDGSKDSLAYACLIKNELLGAGIEDAKEPTEERRVSQGQSPSSGNLFRYGAGRPSEPWSPYSLSPVSAKSHKLLSSPRKQARKISKIPFKVLDAPELQDDFYLNLVDWSSTNVLSVGLGACVYLWSACTSQVTRLCDLSGEGDSVTSVAWAERGHLVAVGTHKGLVQVWDVAASKQTALLQGHRQEVCGLKWSPDNQHLASGGNDNKLLVWNLSSSAPVQSYTEHVAAVKAIAWSPHQHGLLASGGGTADRCIRFWNTLTGQPMQCVDTGSQVCNLAWSKHASELVSTHGYSQNQILVWKYPSLAQVAKLTGHSYRVLYLAVSPDGESVVTGAGDETLRFWNVFSKARSQREARVNVKATVRDCRGKSGAGPGLQSLQALAVRPLPTGTFSAPRIRQMLLGCPDL